MQYNNIIIRFVAVHTKQGLQEEAWTKALKANAYRLSENHAYRLSENLDLPALDIVLCLYNVLDFEQTSIRRTFQVGKGVEWSLDTSRLLSGRTEICLVLLFWKREGTIRSYYLFFSYVFYVRGQKMGEVLMGPYECYIFTALHTKQGVWHTQDPASRGSGSGDVGGQSLLVKGAGRRTRSRNNISIYITKR